MSDKETAKTILEMSSKGMSNKEMALELTRSYPVCTPALKVQEEYMGFYNMLKAID